MQEWNRVMLLLSSTVIRYASHLSFPLDSKVTRKLNTSFIMIELEASLLVLSKQGLKSNSFKCWKATPLAKRAYKQLP
jgi:hypothetical protein